MRARLPEFSTLIVSFHNQLHHTLAVADITGVVETILGRTSMSRANLNKPYQ